MLNAAEFRQIVSGHRQGWGAQLMRSGLRLAELPYTAAVQWRNWRYDQGHAAIAHVAVPVISVGNLTLGGTGKTPTVAWLARWFRHRHVSVGLVSRGYGARRGPSTMDTVKCNSPHPTAGLNDEALELQLLLPEVPHVQNADRVSASQQAIGEYDAELILLDDAFQHRRVHRDLDVVLVDACEPDGFGHVFPRGTLREPLTGLRRADVVILSRTDMVDDRRRQAIWAQLAPFLSHAAIRLEVTHQPIGWRTGDGQPMPLERFRGKQLAAFCGIGNPASFRHSLQACQCNVLELRQFPDHHAYRGEDLQQLDSWVQALTANASAPPDAVSCTLKDLVKLNRVEIGGRPLVALEIGLKPSEATNASWNEFEQLLEKQRVNAGARKDVRLA